MGRKRGIFLSLSLVAAVILVQELRLSRMQDTPEWKEGIAVEEPLFLLLGGMKPLIVDYVWLRADANYREGRYWELLADFDLLTRLQRRNEMVWFWYGYHLVFNLCSGEEREEKAWVWVERGLDLLIKGMAANPKSDFLRIFSSTVLLHRCRGNAYFQEKFKEAKQLLPSEMALSVIREAVSLQPDQKVNTGCLIIGLEKAGLDQWREGNLEKAKALLQEASQVWNDKKSLLGLDFFFKGYPRWLEGLSSAIALEEKGAQKERERKKEEASILFKKAWKELESLKKPLLEERGEELEGVALSLKLRRSLE